MAIGEIFAFAYDTFCSNKVRFALTALGMVIGTASLILVVTIGLTGKQYVQRLIQAIGANMIYAYYQGGSQTTAACAFMVITLAFRLALRLPIRLFNVGRDTAPAVAPPQP